MIVPYGSLASTPSINDFTVDWKAANMALETATIVWGDRHDLRESEL
jgi:hypothetical protein